MDSRVCNGGASGCTKTITQNANVKLPLDVTAYAELKQVRTKCCGEPEIQVIRQCDGCKLIVSQQIVLSVSIEYGTDVTAESCSADCTDVVGV